MSRREKIIELDEQYRKYIDEHVSNVQKVERVVYCILIRTCGKGTVMNATLDIAHENVKYHDTSKYGDAEFYAYRKNFYPIDDEEKESNLEDFEKAWEHHYTSNKHHPEYWIYNNEVKKMDYDAVLEMIYDLSAMSIKFGGNPFEYFNNHFVKAYGGIVPPTLPSDEYTPIHEESYRLIHAMLYTLMQQPEFVNLFKKEDKKDEKKNS